MKRIFVLLFIGIVGWFWALDATQIASWLEMERVSVGDAVWLVESLDNPSLEKDKISWEKYRGLKEDAVLTAGRLAQVLIKSGKVKGGLLYRLAGWDRYAVIALHYEGLVDENVVCSTPLSGAEMVGIISKVQ
ncbi:hypothetical protein [Thermospira aquatica]|uniref:Uncharacterized protein n=1 Tax=Thermospira aquatica TaxID=2828656 RepID=A0AAX3BG40_9SPIR|nr:hypothetical protein [Thermospira aquatica]URA11246.1 hypothetical protein KDW03_05470 [Thermospira aquatica]